MYLKEFLLEFSTDEMCLEYIKQLIYKQGVFCKKCQGVKNFTRVRKRPVYQCSCGYQIRPLVGTIFEKSTTPLSYWFYAFFLMASTRSGVSAKQIQRELGVTYKTAFRMMHKIRGLMKYSDGKLTGIVEVDETYIGPRWARTSKPNFNTIPKQIVMGMVERNGKAVMRHIPNTGGITLKETIKETVEEGSFIMSDQNPGYTNLHKHGYPHDFVVHRQEYVKKENPEVHTQTIESLWSQVKRQIYGVHRHVSKEYLQSYIDEWTWRYNHRREKERMFEKLIDQVNPNL